MPPYERRLCAEPGCERVFIPKSSRHFFCVKHRRGRPKVQASSVPSPRSSTAQDYAPPVPRLRVPHNARYGWPHRHRRAAWKPVVATGRVRCARGAACLFAIDGVGGFIEVGQLWDLGHPDGESTGGPEHRACNRSAAQRLKGRRSW